MMFLRKAGNPRLATDLLDRHTLLSLPQNEADLLLTEPRLLHAKTPRSPMAKPTGIFSLKLVEFCGLRSCCGPHPRVSGAG